MLISIKRMFCVVIIFSLLLIACGAVCAKSFVNDATERAVIKAEWMKSTKKVVQSINDKEATEIFQFIDKNTILAAPVAQGVRVLESGKTNDWLAVVPLLNKDQYVSEKWKAIFSSSAAAHFFPEIRLIVIKGYVPYSPTAKAIVLLHEGYHAYTFVKHPYEWQSDKEYCYEEVKAHTFENRVMNLLGGKKYQAVLNKEVVRITARAKKYGGKIGNIIADRAEYNEELASAFGQPISKSEKDFVQTSVWIHAVFVFLEKNFKGNAENQKALFMRVLYKEEGVMQ